MCLFKTFPVLYVEIGCTYTYTLQLQFGFSPWVSFLLRKPIELIFALITKNNAFIWKVPL